MIYIDSKKELVKIKSISAIDSKFFSNNNDFLIYKGEFDLSFNGKEYPLNGKISFTYYPKPRIEISGELTLRRSFYNELLKTEDPKVLVYIPNFEPTKANITTIQDFRLIKGFVDYKLHTYENENIDTCYFFVNNFIEYYGNPVKSDDFLYRGGQLIEYKKWEIQIQKRHDYKKNQIFKKLKESNGYKITHVIKITKKDGSEFKKEKIDIIEEVLTWVLGLCSGRYIGFPIGVGERKRKEVYKEYSTPLMSPYKKINNWFPYKGAHSIELLFCRMLEKFNNSFYSEEIKKLTHWYIEALNATFIENKIINSQIFLEKVSFILLTQTSNSTMSVKKYKNNKFQTNLEKILSTVSINTGLNGKYNKFNKDFNSGPEILIKYRNHIAHPQRIKIIDNYTIEDIFLIKQLGLYYVEVLLLYLIDYTGQFMNRLKFPLGIGGHELVPWEIVDN